MIKYAAALACVLLLASCSKEDKTAYKIDLPIKEVMGHVVDPAAWTFWRSSGFIDTAEGTVNLTPTTEEGWLAAETGAATLAESANLLMLPGRRLDDGDWMKYSAQLYDAAIAGRQAAIDQDEVKMFETGGKIYEVCTACHGKYIAEEQKPAPTAGLPDVPSAKK